MPTYQYSCTECQHDFEIVQSFSDDSLSVCPECQGRLRKVFNAVGVVFKGSGFYRNDSRGADKSAVAASTNGSTSDGTKSDGAKNGVAKKDGAATPTKTAAPAASGSGSSGSSASAASS